MNATNLYVSTCRLVMQANADDSASWSDMYRLVPFLRQSLSCTVCGNLLIEPYTPTETNCQHHVCKSCKGGKKKLKPSCSWCKDYDKYIENVQLRILLQCYKKLCEYIISSAIYKKLSTVNNSTIINNANTNLLDGTTPTLTNLIQEGAGFADEFRSSRSSNFLMSCFHTNSTSTQTNSASTSTQTNSVPITLPSPENTSIMPFIANGETESSKIVNNASTVYSVQYAGNGNKLTIKRKASESSSDNHDSNSQSPVKALTPPPKSCLNNAGGSPTNSGVTSPKKQTRGKTSSSGVMKTGCRCGNATAVPGKLTCCGQRCACYTESKACVDCKCRGCRNPHMADGQKVCNFQLLAEDAIAVPQCVSLSSNDLVTTAGGTVQVTSVT